MIPDFGKHVIEFNNGGYTTKLECKYVAPGLTFSDLLDIFHKAEAHLQPGDELSGNPSRWPGARGVSAVTDAILNAIYQEKSPE